MFDFPEFRTCFPEVRRSSKYAHIKKIAAQQDPMSFHRPHHVPVMRLTAAAAVPPGLCVGRNAYIWRRRGLCNRLALEQRQQFGEQPPLVAAAEPGTPPNGDSRPYR
jgi:hypothetical protein